MNRYKELRYEDKLYSEQSEIDRLLIKNKFDWFLDCEVENCRLEITKNTLVFNSGTFFNGTWVYGVFRDGQWLYGTWEGGVWYNGTWRGGIFKNGLIFGGRFLKGKIEGGEIRGGEFFDTEIGEQVVNTTIQKMEQPKQKAQSGQPQNRGVQKKVQGQEQPEPVEEQSSKVQPEKIEERVKRFYTFVNEGSQKQEKIFKEIENRMKDYMMMRNGGVEDGEGNEVDATFTTSQETDVKELIRDGLSVEEIISTIKRW